MSLLILLLSLLLQSSFAQAQGQCHEVFSSANPLPGQWVHSPLESVSQNSVSVTGLNEFIVGFRRGGRKFLLPAIFSLWHGPHGELRFLELRYLDKAKGWRVSGRMSQVEGNWVLFIERIWQVPSKP